MTSGRFSAMPIRRCYILFGRNVESRAQFVR